MIAFIVTNVAVAVGALVLGAFVLFREPRNVAYQAFFLFAAGVAFSAIGKPFFREGENLLAVLFVWWGSEAIVFGVFSMVHVFSGGRLNRWFIWSLAPLFLLFISTPVLFVVASSRANSPTFFRGTYHTTLPFFAMVMGVYLAFSLFLCLRRTVNIFDLPSSLARGLMLVVIFSASAICIADLILPALGICCFASASNFLALAILLVGGYVMARYGVGNNSVFFRRGISYFLSLASVAALFFGIEFGIEKFFYQNDEVVDIVAAIIGALVFSPLRNFFNEVTDRIFFRNSYHFLTAVRELGERLSTPLTYGELIDTIAEFIHLTIRPTETVFFAVNENGTDVNLVSGLAVTGTAATDYGLLATLFLNCAYNDMIITDVMRLFRTSHIQGRENTGESVEERAARLGIAAVVPILCQGKIKMIIMVGHKCSGALINKDDGAFLDFVSRRAGIALENLELRELMDRQAERFEERVTARTERLKSMYDSQSKFLVDVSHEFKTPLAILKMHASIFAASEDADQKKAWYVMDTTLDRLSRLVSNLLDATKSGLLRDGSCKKHIAVEDLLQEARDDCAILAEDKGIDLRLSSDKISVFGEWDKLKEVMLNLLSNALQHTPTGGSIFVAAHIIDGEAEITVKDTGFGISRDNLPHIFERFYRIGETGFVGTGIGLYLCRQIVEGHGGTITAESQKGKGSCFIVHMPIFPRDA